MLLYALLLCVAEQGAAPLSLLSHLSCMLQLCEPVSCVYILLILHIDAHLPYALHVCPKLLNAKSCGMQVYW